MEPYDILHYAQCMPFWIQLKAHEMKSVMCNLGEQMNDAEVDIMLKAAEIDEHGQFNYVDFVKTVMKDYWQNKDA